MQKRIIIILILLSIVYFTVFGVNNARGAKDHNMLMLLSQDENIQYPYLIRMIEGSDDLFKTIKNIFAYRHCFYGFPFYVASADSFLLTISLFFTFYDSIIFRSP